MIVRLMGGLGNQMFQYAMGKVAAKKRDEKLFFDKSSFYRDRKRKCAIDSFNTKINNLNFFYVLYYNFFFYFGRTWAHQIWYEKEVFKYQEISGVSAQYFVGAWQHEEYFKSIKNELRKEFTFKEKLGISIEKKKKEILEKNSVAIHVRRGDYLECTDYIVQGMEYYKKAIQYINQRVLYAEYFIFSDDINWCKEHFGTDNNITYISGNTDIEDFFLMSKCKYFIIANSTFSWWAAWLAAKETIKIAPYKWFIDEETNIKVREALLGEFYVLGDENCKI